jgi:hypothetical protein
MLKTLIIATVAAAALTSPASARISLNGTELTGAAEIASPGRERLEFRRCPDGFCGSNGNSLNGKSLNGKSLNGAHIDGAVRTRSTGERVNALILPSGEIIDLR